MEKNYWFQKLENIFKMVKKKKKKIIKLKKKNLNYATALVTIS